MGCIKLDILEQDYKPLKAIKGTLKKTEKVAQRFLSVDPLTSKFPMLTPYQFASNTPIWAVDLDGLEARVYTDLTKFGAPHSFLSVIDDEGVIHVYTYGQYGQSGFGLGPLANMGSALVHLKGEDANNYINHEFEEFPMSVYELSDKVVDKQKIIDYFSKEMETYNIPAEKNKPHAPSYVNEENGSCAVKYKPYVFLLNNGDWNENCSSVMLKWLKEGGVNTDYFLAVPWQIDHYLNILSNNSSLKS